MSVQKLWRQWLAGAHHGIKLPENSHAVSSIKTWYVIFREVSMEFKVLMKKSPGNNRKVSIKNLICMGIFVFPTTKPRAHNPELIKQLSYAIRKPSSCHLSTSLSFLWLQVGCYPASGLWLSRKQKCKEVKLNECVSQVNQAFPEVPSDHLYLIYHCQDSITWLSPDQPQEGS